ncbi:MAG TPA: hypothetical protein IAC03_00215 [Candidatus Coprenecus pullistercoris]|nr:hypothetical protein [Candidatus Coprenecus pullistercoris]
MKAGIIAVCCCLLMLSCSDGGSSFAVLSDDSTSASFVLDMSDSSKIYYIDIVSRFDKGHSPEHVTFSIGLVSPSGRSAAESITLPCGYRSVKSHLDSHPEDNRIRLAGSPGYYDIAWRYRDNISPSEKGLWKLSLTVPDTTEGLIGIGIDIHTIPVAGR